MSSIYEKPAESSILEKSPGRSQERDDDASPEQQPQRPCREDTQAAGRSGAIDEILEKDGKARKRQCNVLPLGAFKMREIIQLLKNDDEIGLMEDELLDYRHSIRQWVISCTIELVESIKTSDFRLDPAAKVHYDYVCGYLTDIDSDTQPSEEFGKAVEDLWDNPNLKEAFESADEPQSKASTIYAFTHIKRLTSAAYTPTETDILQSHHGIRGTTEYRIATPDLPLRLLDVGVQRGERRKWIPQFANTPVVLFVADLARHHLCDDMSRHDDITEQLHAFDGVLNSKWFPDSIFVLFLSNVSAFRRYLALSPLEESFPEYTGGRGGDGAAEYVLRLFEGVNRNQRRLYSYLVDLEPWDPQNLELLVNAVRDGLNSSSGPGVFDKKS